MSHLASPPSSPAVASPAAHGHALSHAHHARPWRRRMSPRDPHEPHRASTPLELLFDLCFVVAIAQLAVRLHHAIGHDHAVAAIPAFGMVFFAIWWAWMNFTWFASAYDVDDTPYRLLVFVQMAGVLTIAAGVPRAFDHTDFSLVTAGYSIMRVAQIAQWLRAAGDPKTRPTARRYALVLALAQLGWIGAAFLPFSLWPFAAAVLVPAELLVPLWAERPHPTPWHSHHIAERYGLLTLIVLGESVLAATLAIQTALDDGHFSPALLGLAIGGLVILFSLWWLYFDVPAQTYLRSNRDSFIWGYGHFIVFGAAAAVGAGLALAVDALTEHPGQAAHVPLHVAGLAVAIPAALFVLSVWVIHLRPLRCGPGWLIAFAATAALLIGAAFTPWPIPAIALLLAALVAWTLRENHRESQRDAVHSPH